MDSPKVFISYSHDSPDHSLKVLQFANRLRNEGIDAVLDQYFPAPSQGWPRWMEGEIDKADFVLLICTDTYCRRIMGKEESGKGLGVTWEGSIIYNKLYSGQTANTKFIPVLFESNTIKNIPTPLQGYTFYPADTVEGYNDLCRILTGQPKCTMPELGNKTIYPPLDAIEQKTKFISLDNYLNWISDECGFIDIRGFEVGNARAHKFTIDRLYVPLSTHAAGSGLHEKKNDKELKSKTPDFAGSGRIDLYDEALRQKKRGHYRRTRFRENNLYALHCVSAREHAAGRKTGRG